MNIQHLLRQYIALMHDWLKGKIIVDSLGLHSK